MISRCTLDLSTYRHEETHELWVDLEGGAGKLHILLTITGRSSPELLNLTDLSNVRLEDEAELQRKFSARYYLVRRPCRTLQSRGLLVFITIS